MSHSVTKNSIFSVGNALEENKLPIILYANTVGGAFWMAYLFYSPRQVRNIQ